jgi:hypothetical protein
MNLFPINDNHDPMLAPHTKAKGRHVVPHPERQSKEYPKEKFYSVVNLDMNKFRDARLGDISMSNSTFGDVNCSAIEGALLKDDDDSDHVVALAAELPSIMENTLTMSNRSDQDEVPVYFQNLPTNYASSSDDDDDDSCYDDLLNDEHTKFQPMVQEGQQYNEASQQSLYMLQTSADMSAYEQASFNDSTSYQEELGG